MPDGTDNAQSGQEDDLHHTQEDKNIFLFLCNFIHEGYYNMRITWGEVRRMFSFAVSGDILEICRVMKSEGYIQSYEDSDPFMILREINVDIGHEAEIKTIRGLLDVVREFPLPYNVAVISYLQKGLMMGIIGSFYDHELNFASTPQERVLISTVTSEPFLANRSVSELLEKEISTAEFANPGMEDYIQYPWFNELIQIVKHGYYGNGGINYVDALESSFRVEFTNGILEILGNGGLLWLILNFKQFIKNEKVDSATKKFVKKSHEERSINRIYDWLSLINDFAVGVEFLIGSIEFLPHHDSTLGVYIFIIGSTQLLIRPIIALGRKIHLQKLENRKIRF